MRTAIIDGDIFIFQAAAANEYECQWSDWMWTLHADLDAAICQLDSTLAQIQEDTQADRIVIALTDVTNWRKDVMPTYKHHRVKTRKPVIYQPMREYCAEKFQTFQRPGLEGDDIIGILSTHKYLLEGEKIIVSIDKDMKTIPGRHLRLDDDARGIRTITVDEADYWHMMQTLTGDSTDGYPGCPGCGPVGAGKILDGLWGDSDTGRFFPVDLVWPHVVAAYAKKGLSEEVALQNARVARICRADDYDFAKKEVRLWSPRVPATS